MGTRRLAQRQRPASLESGHRREPWQILWGGWREMRVWALMKPDCGTGGEAPAT